MNMLECWAVYILLVLTYIGLGCVWILSFAIEPITRGTITRENPLEMDLLQTDLLKTDPLKTDPLQMDPLHTDPLQTDPLHKWTYYK